MYKYSRRINHNNFSDITAEYRTVRSQETQTNLSVSPANELDESDFEEAIDKMKITEYNLQNILFEYEPDVNEEEYSFKFYRDLLVGCVLSLVMCTIMYLAFAEMNNYNCN